MHGQLTTKACRVHAAALLTQPSEDNTAVQKAGLKVLELDTKTEKACSDKHCAPPCKLCSGVCRPFELLPESCYSGPTEHLGHCRDAMRTHPDSRGAPCPTPCSGARAGAAGHCIPLACSCCWQGSEHPPRPPIDCKVLSRWQRSHPPYTLHPLRLTANIASAPACGALHCSVKATSQPSSMHTVTAVPHLPVCPWPQGAAPRC